MEQEPEFEKDLDELISLMIEEEKELKIGLTKRIGLAEQAIQLAKGASGDKSQLPQLEKNLARLKRELSNLGKT